MVGELRPDDPVMVGPYRLLGLLALGVAGPVYLAESPAGQQVAVRVIRTDPPDDPGGFRVRWASNVRVTRQVSGQFLIPVVEADTEAAAPWVATVYVPGPTLQEAVPEHGLLPMQSLLTLAAGLAEGLQAIHAAGLVYRALNPSHVLMASDGPYMLNPWISGSLASGIMGHPAFLSPEQAEGRAVGPPSDIFSLGCVVTFAASGDGPYGTGQSEPPLLYRIVNGDPDLTRVPAPLRPLIERCLAKDPARRPTARALVAYLSGRH
jgi:eukaryotic-like serine/threonine-protein kinase